MGLPDLIRENPWPPQPPAIPAIRWGWGIEGASLLRKLIDPGATRVVLEIGSLLGGSARFWFEELPHAHILCVDPWTDVVRAADRPFLAHVPELVDVVVGKPDGLYNAFVAANWEFRDRITPLRGFSPDRLASVHAAGVHPDVVYVDGSHVYEDVIADLAIARALFPNALLCGDDYHWPAVAAAAEYIVATRGDRLLHEGNTFAIERSEEDSRRAGRSALPVGPVRRTWAGRSVSRLRNLGR